MGALLNLDPSTMTEEQKQAYSNLMGTLVSGVTSAVGGDATAAQLATKIEEDNNYLKYRNRVLLESLREKRKTASSMDERRMIDIQIAALEKEDRETNQALYNACAGASANKEDCTREAGRFHQTMLSWEGNTP